MAMQAAIHQLHGAPKTWMGHPVLPELIPHILGMSAELQLRLSSYVELNRIPIEKMLRVDLALALIRIDTAEARMFAQELTGCAITKCPAAMPVWPPKPVAARYTTLRVSWVRSDNPCRASADTHRRFALVKVGLTIEQMKARGVVQRDIDHWRKRGWLEFKR